MDRFANPDRTLFYFNMEDPVVGGMTPDKVALRRAISLATDVRQEIRGIRRGQAIPAQSVVAPGSYGYDPSLPQREQRLRRAARQGAARPLRLRRPRRRRLARAARRQAADHRLREPARRDLDASSTSCWKKNMDAIGIRLRIKAAQWPEQLKAARAGQLQVWQLGYSAASPDVQDGLQILYGPASGGQNLGRFKDAHFDELYRRMQSAPDGPERLKLLPRPRTSSPRTRRRNTTCTASSPTSCSPGCSAFGAPLYGNQFWQYIDIDPAKKASASSRSRSQEESGDPMRPATRRREGRHAVPGGRPLRGLSRGRARGGHVRQPLVRAGRAPGMTRSTSAAPSRAPRRGPPAPRSATHPRGR